MSTSCGLPRQIPKSRNFTVNGSSVLIFGVANTTEPASYNLQGLTLNGGTQLQIVGPVTLTLRNGTNINGSIGNAANPQWLTLNVSNGGVTLNGGSQMFGKVNAPAGSVTVNSRLTGNVICDRLTVNGGGVVTILAQAPQDTTAPVITIAEPAQGLITKTSPVTVSGTVTDASAVTVTVNGQPVTLSGTQFSTTVTLAEGPNTLTVLATDAFGNVGTASRNVTLDTTAPVLTITFPQDGTTTTETQLTITGTVTDATATTVTVNNVAATRNGNEFSAVVSLVEGANTFIIRAEDAAGNQTETTRTVTLQVPQDTTPPAITLTEPAEGLITNVSPVTVSGTVTDVSAVTVTVNNQPVTLSGTQFTASATLTEGSNTITVSATDAFGNASTVSRSVVLDTIAPVVTITSPEDGATTTEPQITVTGSVTDATTINVTVNDITATLNGNEFSAAVPLSEGSNTLLVRATDMAGNQTEQTRTVNYQAAPPLLLNIFSPSTPTTKSGSAIEINGYVSGVNVAVTANELPLTVDVPNNYFSGVVPVNEGENTILVVATDSIGGQVEKTLQVTIDNQVPVISNLFPVPNTLVESPTITVEGTVVDNNLVTVEVNRIPAVLSNGSFVAENVPLEEGNNYLYILATDAAGNFDIEELKIIGKDKTPPAPPVVFPMTSPTKLGYQTLQGVSKPGAYISIQGGKTPITTRSLLKTGLFVINVDLNPGLNTLSITSADADGNVSASTELQVISNPDMSLPPPGEPTFLSISTGNAQFGLIETELPRPLVVFVSDRAGNPVANVPVTFSVRYGGGRFIDGEPTSTLTTNAQGRVAIRYICGPTPGIQIINAEAAGNIHTPASFMVEAVEDDGGQVTSVSGVVLDQNQRALPHALIRLGGQQVYTGQDGRFTLKNVASGPHQLLEVIGRDQVMLPGRWPNISFDIDVLPGVDNYQRRPLFLPRVNEGIFLPLNENNVVMQDTTYELPVVAGESPIRVTAKAGTQVLFPPDIADKRFSVTRILSSHIPMGLEDGRATNLYISVQPSGTLFDPPLEVSFPNLDREPANAPVLLMSFDHDAGRYVQVGTGHVSANGKSVVGDPGSGIRIGAWHAFPPPAPEPEKSLTGDSNECTTEVWSDTDPAVPLGDTPPTEAARRSGQCEAPMITYLASSNSRSSTGALQGKSKAPCLYIRFISQNQNADIPFEGEGNNDAACLMVSKYVTNDSLYNLVDFDGKPLFNPLSQSPADPDTFRVQAVGCSIDTPPLTSYRIRVEILRNGKKLSYYDHTFGTVNRNENGRTVYRTDKFLRLVSNQVDDEYENGIEYTRDQTVLVQLGDRIQVTLYDTSDGDKVIGKPKTLPVARPSSEKGPNAIRTGTCRFILPYFPEIKQIDIKAAMERLNEHWAQCAIRINTIGSSEVNIVNNSISITGKASDDGTISIPYNGQIQTISIASGGNPEPFQIAQQISEILNSLLFTGHKVAFSFNSYPHYPQALIVIRKGQDFDVSNIKINIPGCTVEKVISNPSFTGVSAIQHAQIIANFGDSNPNTMDITIVGSHELLQYGGCNPLSYVGLMSSMRNTISLDYGTMTVPSMRTPFTLAHETGRALLNKSGDDCPNAKNIMCATSSQDTILATKRFTLEQQITARQNLSGALLK